MRQTLYIIIITVLCSTATKAQEQVLPDPYLKVIKKDGVITISQPDDDYSFSFPGDTVYRIQPHEIMIVEDNGLMGVIDPWDLYWMAKPVYSYIGPFTEEMVLVRKKGKYSVVAPFEDGFDKPYIKVDTLYPFTPQDELVYNDMNLFLLENKGKYGLYNIWYFYEEFLPVKFDEIILVANHEGGIVYKLRKGNKWGAGDCETLETKIIYDDIDWLTGSCQDNYFRVKEDGKFGIVATWTYGEYLYPPEFDKISFAGNHIGNGYFILKKGGKWDVVDDTFPFFEPRYDNVWLMETEGLTRISMQAGNEITTLEIEY